MLSDSKIREVGFIRTNSSRKIIFNPQIKQSSDDSFSSFQYERSQHEYKQTKYHVQRISQLNKKQGEQLPIPMQIYQKNNSNKVLTPKHPLLIPKPLSKKPPYPNIQQISFQNEKLRNNFFNESSHYNVNSAVFQQDQKSQENNNNVQFSQNSNQFSGISKDLQRIKSICNQIGTMKLEGNFSFNPKNQIKNNKTRNLQEISQQKYQQKYQQNIIKVQNQNKHQHNQQIKQNNYFQQNRKFQYQSSDDEQSDRLNVGRRPEAKESCKSSSDEEAYFQSKNNINSNKVRQKQNNKSSRAQYEYSQVHPKKATNSQTKPNNSLTEQLIVQYNNKQFANIHKKGNSKIHSKSSLNAHQHQQSYHYENQQDHSEQYKQQGTFQKTGGVCFEVDVKQFNKVSNLALNNANTQHRKQQMIRKKNPQREKEELLRRRQQAMMYSKQARFRLFGFA